MERCDVVDGCRNKVVECIGGEVYTCCEHLNEAPEVYEAWQREKDSPCG